MEPTLNPESGYIRFRVDFAYDGTRFSGWAKQPGQRTIQDELEKSITGLTRFDVELVVAGRTDAGVHATAQVAHFDLPERDKYGKEWGDLAYRLNRMLDEDIRIKSILKAPPFFHARFSALRRSYTYKIGDSRNLVNPLLRYDIATWYRDLNLQSMNEASELLLGEHDFAAFCKTGGVGTTIRRLEKFNWRREGELLVADIVADAFCYSMVRNLVGAIVRVGEGRFAPAWVAQVLANRERVSESLVFPARGLTLVSVEYPKADELAARATITMARRDED